MILAAAKTLPGGTGYVAAAYLIFLLLVLVYLAITAVRLGRLERELVELDDLASSQQPREQEQVVA